MKAPITIGPGRRADRFISYAQNLEDVLLWRALHTVGSGFYIDLGAGEPEADSVTKAFYDRGWRGINAEPMPKAFERLSSGRPRDINLRLGVGDESGRRTFFSIDDQSGLSTGDRQLALAYAEAGRAVTELEVEVTTLTDICRTYVDREIHFLKVDVEGSEGLVFAGADLRAYRPWIIVVESPEAAIDPQTPEWHALLEAGGYSFVHYDGLNRFYIAGEKSDLLGGAFESPPNWFDNYVSAEVAQLEIAAARLNADLSGVRERLALETDRRQSAESDASEARSVAANLRDQLGSTEAELSSARRELDLCYQALFEDSRRIDWLSAQRQALLDRVKSEVGSRSMEIGHLREQITALQEGLRRMEGSRAWRMTRPIRAVAWAMRGVGRRAR